MSIFRRLRLAALPPPKPPRGRVVPITLEGGPSLDAEAIRQEHHGGEETGKP